VAGAVIEDPLDGDDHAGLQLKHIPRPIKAANSLCVPIPSSEAGHKTE
jgi:hypothetical protein